MLGEKKKIKNKPTINCHCHLIYRDSDTFCMQAWDKESASIKHVSLSSVFPVTLSCCFR